MSDEGKTSKQTDANAELKRLRRRLVALEAKQRKQAELLKTLRASEEKYRSLVERSTDGLIIIQDGIIKYVNPSLACMWGGRVEEIVGTSFVNYIHPNDAKILAKRYSRCREGKRVPNIYEARLLRKNGSEIWVELNAGLILHDGAPANIISVRDISDRKNIEKALGQTEERIQNIIRHSSSMFYSHTPDHMLTYVSPQSEQILGCKPEEAMVRWQEFLTDNPVNQKGIEATARAIRTGKRQPPYELELLTRDGRKIWVLVDESPVVENGKTVAIVGSLTDITARKQAEEAERKQRQLSDALRSALEAGASLSASLEFNAILDRLLESLEQVIPFEGGSVLLIQPQTGKVQTARIRGYKQNTKSEREKIRSLELEIGSAVNLRYMYENRQALIIADTHQDPTWIPVSETDYLRCWMGAPIIVNQEVIAFFSLQHSQPGFFTAEHVSLLQAFSGQAALALQNARLFEEIRHRAEEMAALLSTSMSLSGLNLQTILHTIGQQAKSIFAADGCRIFLLEPDSKTLRCELALQEDENAFSGLTIQVGQGVTGAVALSGEAEIVNDMTKDPRAVLVPGTQEEPEAIMFAPLKQRQQTVGVISVRRIGNERPFNTADLELLKAFASLAASAVANARLFDETRRRADLLAALHTISQKLSNILDVQAIGDMIIPEIEKLLNWERGSIWLLDNENHVYLLTHSIPGLKGEKRQQELERLRSLIKKPGEGIVGTVIQTGQAIRSRNVRETDVYIEGNPETRSELCVPLKTGQQTIGCINFESNRENAFTEDDEQLMTTLAGEVAIAIERARFFEEARRRVEEFTILYNITSDLGAFTSVEALVQEIPHRIMNLLNVTGAGVYLYRKAENELELASITPPLIPTGTRLHMGEGMAGRVAQSRKPSIIADYQKWSLRCRKYDNLSFAAVVEVPMFYGSELFGVISAFTTADDLKRKQRRFSDNDVQLLSLFAASAASALHGILLLEDARQRVHELETLQAVSSELRQARTLQEMIPIFVKYSAQAIGAKSGSIYLLEESRSEWVAIGWVNADGSWSPPQGNMRHKFDEGVTGHVGTSGEIYITEDWRTDPVTVTLPVELPYLNSLKCGISIPLHAEESIIGVMHLWFPETHIFTEAEKRLLTAIADMAGSAIQRARLYDETQKRLRYISTLHNIDTAINASVDLNITLKIILGNAIRELGVDAAAIALLLPQSRALEYIASHGFQACIIEGVRLHPGEDLAWQAIIQRQIVSLDAETQKKHDIFRAENFVSQYAIPLVAKGQVQGVLQVFHRAPLNPSPDWFNFLTTLAGQTAVAVDSATLYENLQRSNLELSLAYDATIEGWSRALDLRDRETEGHTQRVTELTVSLARAVGLSEEQIVHIRRGALLHDIGKMGVPDNILFKQGELTPEEQEIMRQHPKFAYDMLSPIEYLRPALDIPYCHHERWDGSGYPRGLKGEEIPLAARLFAVVDVYDAITSDRPYRKAWSQQKAMEYLQQQAGKHFDPQAVKAFLNLLSTLPPTFNRAGG